MAMSDCFQAQQISTGILAWRSFGVSSFQILHNGGITQNIRTFQICCEQLEKMRQIKKGQNNTMLTAANASTSNLGQLASSAVGLDEEQVWGVATKFSSRDVHSVRAKNNSFLVRNLGKLPQTTLEAVSKPLSGFHSDALGRHISGYDEVELESEVSGVAINQNTIDISRRGLSNFTIGEDGNSQGEADANFVPGKDVQDKSGRPSVSVSEKEVRRIPMRRVKKITTNNPSIDDDVVIGVSDTQELVGSGANAGLRKISVHKAEEGLDADAKLEADLVTVRHLMTVGDTDGARVFTRKLKKIYPDNTKVLLYNATLERKCGDLVSAGALYAEAVNIFESTGEVGIEYIRALQSWGSLEAQGGNPMRARVLFMESINAARQEEFQSGLQGAGVYALHAWAMLEKRLGNWSKACTLLDRAAQLQPGNAIIHQSRALMEARAHNYANARHHFKLAVEAAPDDVKCWQAWALFEAGQRKQQKMRELFKRALKTEPTNLHSLQAWARQEGLIGTEASRMHARELYQRCIEINPQDMHSWQAWAILEKNSGNLSGARALFERGLSANPSSVPCLQAYAHMERRCDNLMAAQKLLQAAIAIDPQNAASLMELAFVEEKLGRVELANELFCQAGMIDRQKSRIKKRMFESRKQAKAMKQLEINIGKQVHSVTKPPY